MRREPSCINYGEIEISTNNNVEVLTRSWSDLPAELLSLIADRLGIIELPSFCGVCKAWQAASSAASAKIESASNPQRKYTMNIPQLDGATCIASNQGWLLIFKQGSMFFYCPFSHTKIDLPKFPHLVILSEHASAFSSPPTSPECIVAVMNRDPEYGLELYVLCRGACKWSRRKLKGTQYNLSAFGFATYKNGNFYFLDKINGGITFSVKDGRCLRCVTTVKKKKSPDVGNLNHVSISTCGTRWRCGNRDEVVFGESIEAAGNSKSRRLEGVWIQPRFFQVSPNQNW
ncbi:hypothetical protein SLA2020_420050 [Shorea laevis]